MPLLGGGQVSNFVGVIGGMPAGSDPENLAGAVGFEPTPSALTVRCPTGWTTPQQIQNASFSPLKIMVVRETRKPVAKKTHSGFSVGNPASVQARQPPSIEMQFV